VVQEQVHDPETGFIGQGFKKNQGIHKINISRYIDIVKIFLGRPSYFRLIALSKPESYTFSAQKPAYGQIIKIAQSKSLTALNKKISNSQNNTAPECQAKRVLNDSGQQPNNP